jgi:hypothetical protein
MLETGGSVTLSDMIAWFQRGVNVVPSRTEISPREAQDVPVQAIKEILPDPVRTLVVLRGRWKIRVHCE